ncbi:MAG: hypothetical protein JO253_08050 [Alphaproteobacteria bacterium]|nr:hypothetical protein [Alphaproteobacteria bacterium]
MTTPRVKGTAIDFADGSTLIVPPLSLASVEALQDRLVNYKGGLGDVSVVIDALHASLKRNYPDMTRDQVAELVDIANMQDVMLAVMNTSGLKSKGDAAGEAKGESR